jgi:NADH-quinone oxidoreductase subunit N
LPRPALFFYLAAYAFMNLAAFGVITIRERQTGFGDDIRSVQGLGRERPVLAWSLTIAMLALAGLPGTAGFIGKLYLIQASVAADFTWLGVMIAVGTMISLAYYLRVIAAIWMRPAYLSDPTPEAGHRVLPAMAGGAATEDEGDTGGVRCRVIIAFSVIAAAASVFFGVLPSPLVDFVSGTGEAITSSLD